MKKLLNVLALTLALNFVAVVSGVGWLWGSGHLNREKVLALKAVVFPPQVPIDAEGKHTAPAPTTQPFLNLDELLATHSGKRTGEQVDIIQQAFDVQSAQLDRRRRELDTLAEQVAREQKALADAGAALDGSQRKLEEQEKQDENLAGDKGFQDSLKLYSAMPPAQVKKVFQTLSQDTVVAYLQAMPPRAATKIVKEFKSPEELELIHQVLEKMRHGGTGSASASTTPGGADGLVRPGAEAIGPGVPKEGSGVIGPSPDEPAPLAQ